MGELSSSFTSARLSALISGCRFQGIHARTRSYIHKISLSELVWEWNRVARSGLQIPEQRPRALDEHQHQWENICRGTHVKTRKYSSLLRISCGCQRRKWDWVCQGKLNVYGYDWRWNPTHMQARPPKTIKQVTRRVKDSEPSWCLKSAQFFRSERQIYPVDDD